jgi:hypothetical protein
MLNGVVREPGEALHLLISDPRPKAHPGREPLPNHAHNHGAAPKSPPRTSPPLLFPHVGSLDGTGCRTLHNNKAKLTERMDAVPMRKQGEYTHTSRPHVCTSAACRRISTKGAYGTHSRHETVSLLPLYRADE